MAILNIIKFGDPLLRKTSRPVETITPRIITLLEDMKDTMREAQGCGLAAVQVGVLRRVVVIEVVEGEVIELINPRIIAYSGEQENAEGCLSFPGNYGLCKRPAHVTVRAMDRYGKTFDITGDGLLARALCHECDHLDGKIYTDIQLRPLSPKEVEKYR